MGRAIKNVVKIRIILLVIIAAFLILQLSQIKYSLSEENLYFYDAKLVAEGKTPYKDFFFAHPPIHLYALALIYKVVEFNFFVLKSLSLVATVITALFLFETVKMKLSDREALISVFLFLSSFAVLLTSHYNTGVNLSLAFIMMGFYFHFKKWHVTSGLLLGMAAMTGLYSAVVPLVLGLVLLFGKRFKAFCKLCLGFVLVFGGLFLIFLGLVGVRFLEQVLLYHLNKTGTIGSGLGILFNMIKYDALVFILIVVSFFSLKNKKNRKSIPTYLFIIVGYLVFILLLKKAFPYYTLLLFPFLAVAASKGMVWLLDRFKSLSGYLPYILVVIVLINAAIAVVMSIRSVNYLEADKALQLSVVVSNRGSKTAELIGDTDMAPLVALLSGRRIAMDITDTNDMRFESGNLGLEKLFVDLKEHDDFKFFIYSEGYGIAKFQRTLNWIALNCPDRVSFISTHTYNVAVCV